MVTKKIIFLLHLVALVLYRIYGYSGHFGFDDIEYAHLAFELSQGNFLSDNHFSYRLSILIPTAISYLLFGVNDWASSIPPMLCSSLILLLVYQFVKKQNVLTVFLALSFTLFTEWFLFYGNKIMVDIYVCLAFTAVLYVFYHFLFIKTKSVHIYALALAASLFFGFNSKGTIILIVPLLLFFFIIDLWSKRHYQFWKLTILYSTLLVVFYIIACKLITGDYLTRFYAIGENSYLNRCSYAEQPLKIQLARIAIDFWKMLRHDGFALISLVVLAPLISLKSLYLLKLKDPLSFFVSSSIILILSSNFMSISPTHYNPMCIDFRHYLYIVPISGVAAAYLLGNWTIFQKIDKTVLVGLLLIGLSYKIETDEYLYRLYLPAFAVLLLYSILRRMNYLKTSNFLFFLIPILLIQPIYMVSSTQDVAYNEQRELIVERLLNSDEKKVILTDKVQKNIGRYWLGFDQKQYAFIDFEDFEKDKQGIKPNYLLLNSYTQFYAGTYETDLPLSVQYLVDHGEVTFESDKPKLKIIELNKGVGQEIDRSILFKTENNYVEEEGWHYSKEALQYENENVFEKVWEYSSTYRHRLDSIVIDTNQYIRLNVEMETKFLEKTEAIIVATVVLGDETLYWTAREVNGYQRAYGNWWKVKTTCRIPIKQRYKDAELVLFLWNRDKKDARIDNFRIDAYQF